MSAGVPVCFVPAQAAAGNETMDMGMIDQGPGPGAEDGHDPDLSPEVLWVGGEFGDGLGGGLHENGI